MLETSVLNDYSLLAQDLLGEAGATCLLNKPPRRPQAQTQRISSPPICACNPALHPLRPNTTVGGLSSEICCFPPSWTERFPGISKLCIRSCPPFSCPTVTFYSSLLNLFSKKMPHVSKWHYHPFRASCKYLGINLDLFCSMSPHPVCKPCCFCDHNVSHHHSLTSVSTPPLI